MEPGKIIMKEGPMDPVANVRERVAMAENARGVFVPRLAVLETLARLDAVTKERDDLKQKNGLLEDEIEILKSTSARS